MKYVVTSVEKDFTDDDLLGGNEICGNISGERLH